jgi:hypothetical protein
MDTKQQQIQEWSKVYDRPISDEELTAEINANLNGFFTTLKEWDDEERTKLENERTCSVGNPNNSSQT